MEVGQNRDRRRRISLVDSIQCDIAVGIPWVFLGRLNVAWEHQPLRLALYSFQMPGLYFKYYTTNVAVNLYCVMGRSILETLLTTTSQT